MYKYVLAPDCHCDALIPQEVDAAWHVIEPFFKQAVDHFFDDFDLNACRRAILSNPDTALRCWAVYYQDQLSAVFLTRFVNDGVNRVMNYVLIGGENFDHWVPELIHKFEQLLVAELGVTQFRIVGRLGWARKMRKYGYDYSHVVCVRNVNIQEQIGNFTGSVCNV